MIKTCQPPDSSHVAFLCFTLSASSHPPLTCHFSVRLLFHVLLQRTAAGHQIVGSVAFLLPAPHLLPVMQYGGRALAEQRCIFLFKDFS